MSKRVLFSGAVAAVVVFSVAKVYADDAVDIEQFYPVGSYAQYDDASGDYPIITAIGSQPGTFGGHTYTGWSVFAQDATGSLNLFISAATLTTLTGNANATLSVGDKINVAGQCSSFHQIPEITFSTNPASNNYLQIVSSGNPLPTPPVFSISQLNQGNVINPTIPFNQAGYFLEVPLFYISSPSNGLTTLPGYTTVISNETFTMTDNTGSMTFFDWTSSFSSAAHLADAWFPPNLVGTPIGPYYLYEMYGFVSVNPGGPAEFTPLLNLVIPEPSPVVLVASGLLGLLALRRRKQKRHIAVLQRRPIRLVGRALSVVPNRRLQHHPSRFYRVRLVP